MVYLLIKPPCFAILKANRRRQFDNLDATEKLTGQTEWHVVAATITGTAVVFLSKVQAAADQKLRLTT